MPSHIDFYGRILAYRAYRIDGSKKHYKKEPDPNKQRRGYLIREMNEAVLDFVQIRRQCVVSSYEMYRENVEKWNPGRPAWKTSGAPVEYGRRARIGQHRGRQGLDAFKGGHEIYTNKEFQKIDAQPVSAEEWTNCLARDCPLDQTIKLIFEQRKGIQLMLIRGGDGRLSSNKESAEGMKKLKRIEMGAGDNWEIVWSNCGM